MLSNDLKYVTKRTTTLFTEKREKGTKKDKIVIKLISSLFLC